MSIFDFSQALKISYQDDFVMIGISCSLTKSLRVWLSRQNTWEHLINSRSTIFMEALTNLFEKVKWKRHSKIERFIAQKILKKHTGGESWGNDIFFKLLITLTTL